LNGAATQDFKFAVEGAGSVSARLVMPQHPQACFVFAHGAGAGMTHKFMETAATGLGERGIASLRYQFPYMERRSGRPDPPAIAHAAVRAAVAEAARRYELPLIAGGKSFGGRMTSQAQALAPLPGVRGLAFFAFPLHPAGKPSDARARHLSGIHVPMLFLQGTRDTLADFDLLRPLADELPATLHPVEGADHAFHVLVRSGRNDAAVMDEILDAFADWARAVIGAGAAR
jgi:predicted alpha/beta-hydrolase family hydrolase